MPSAGIVAAPGGLVNVEFHGVFTDTGNDATTRTFNNVPFGNPASDRRIVVGYVGAMSTGNLPTIVVDGDTLTNLTGPGGWENSFGVLFDDVPNKSEEVYSGTITVTPGIVSNGLIIGVWSIRRNVLPSNNQGAWGVPSIRPTSDVIDFREGGAILGLCGVNAGATGAGQSSVDHDKVFFDEWLPGNSLAGWAGVLFPSITADDQTINASITGTNFAYAAYSFEPE